MPMKNPAHPGRIIRSNLQALWMSVEETAPKLGLTPEQLSQVIDGEASVTDAMAAGLGELFGCGADIWRRMQASYDEAQERNKYDVPEEPEPWVSCPEQAAVPLKNGRAIYTTYDDTVLRFRYLESGNTTFPWWGKGTYDQVEIRFGGAGPGALQIQLIHQPKPTDTPRLVADVLFKAYLVWAADPDGRPWARINAREWRREWAKLKAGKKLMRDLYAGLAKPSSLPVFQEKEFVETGSERRAIVLKDAEALREKYTKVVGYRALARV